MFSELKLYGTAFVAFLAVDLIWIGFVMKKFYIERLRPIGRISGNSFEPVMWAALGVYVALTLGLVHFVLPKIAPEMSWLDALGIGALFGFVVYGTYDFTNYSTLKDWTVATTFTDIAWGAALSGIVTLIVRTVRDGF